MWEAKGRRIAAELTWVIKIQQRRSTLSYNAYVGQRNYLKKMLLNLAQYTLVVANIFDEGTIVKIPYSKYADHNMMRVSSRW